MVGGGIQFTGWDAIMSEPIEPIGDNGCMNVGIAGGEKGAIIQAISAIEGRGYIIAGWYGGRGSVDDDDG